MPALTEALTALKCRAILIARATFTEVEAVYRGEAKESCKNNSGHTSAWP